MFCCTSSPVGCAASWLISGDKEAARSVTFWDAVRAVSIDSFDVFADFESSLARLSLSGNSG